MTDKTLIPIEKDFLKYLAEDYEAEDRLWKCLIEIFPNQKEKIKRIADRKRDDAAWIRKYLEKFQ